MGRLKPILALYEFDEAWNLHQCHIHSIEGLNYAHDFLLLPDYYIIHMTPFVSLDWWTVSKVVMGWASLGSSMRHYPNLPSRFIVIPRHKQAKYQEILQLDTEPFHVSINSTVCLAEIVLQSVYVISKIHNVYTINYNVFICTDFSLWCG